MADRVLFIGWGPPVRGREERGLEVFGDALGLLGRMQQDGRIEGFDVCILDPNGDLAGFMVIRGTDEQISGLRRADDFRRSTADAQMIVENVRHVEGYTNEGIAAQMAIWQEAIGKVPQGA